MNFLRAKAMQEYKGVRYMDLGNGELKVVWPSGVSSVIKSTIEDLKKEVDKVSG